MVLPCYLDMHHNINLFLHVPFYYLVFRHAICNCSFFFFFTCTAVLPCCINMCCGIYLVFFQIYTDINQFFYMHTVYIFYMHHNINVLRHAQLYLIVSYMYHGIIVFFSWYYHATTLFFDIVPQLFYHGITMVYLLYHDNAGNKYHGFWICIMLILFFYRHLQYQQ